MDKYTNINLNLYKSFYYVAKCGGFTKASEYVLLSQSSLSSNVKNLEEILEKKLFNRTSNSFSLTEDGKILLSKIEEVLGILEDDIDKKEINIGCLRFIGDNYISNSIIEFKNKYPDVKLNIAFTNTADLYQMLRKDELDIIISRYPVFYKFESNIKVEKLMDVENIFVCSKEYYEKEKNKMKNKNYVFSMILPVSSGKRRTVEQYLIDENINYTLDIELPNSILLKDLILRNVGVGYINKKFIEKEIKSNQLVMLDMFKNLPQDNITIIYNSNKMESCLKDFIKILKETIGKTDS